MQQQIDYKFNQILTECGVREQIVLSRFARELAEIGIFTPAAVALVLRVEQLDGIVDFETGAVTWPPEEVRP